jgi:dimethylglycine dehydrogenase
MRAKGRYLGMETELITPSEAKALFPLMDPRAFRRRALGSGRGPSRPLRHHPRLRQGGAQARRRDHRATKVEELIQDADGTWNVVTEQGTIKAEHVVNAGGLWAREVGRMVGLELPVLAMEHMYLLTEDMPEVPRSTRRPARN